MREGDKYMLKYGTKDMYTKIRLMKAGNFTAKLIRFVFLVTICFVVLYPLIYMFSVSIRESVDLYDTSVIWIPKHFTMDNYKLVWTTVDYPVALLNTIIISTGCTIINVGVCASIGYGFARFNFTGKKTLFALCIFTLMVPIQTVAIPMYSQYYTFDFFGIGLLPKLFGGRAITMNILNTGWTLVLPAIFGQGIRSGLFVYIFRQFFRSMPKELEDAAYIDGCGMFGTFLRVMLVNAGPAIISCIMFSFVWYWNEYYQVGLFFSELQTLPLALGTLQGVLRSAAGMDMYTDPYVQVAALQAACMLTILPLLVMFVVLQSKFTESIDKTGIVG